MRKWDWLWVFWQVILPLGGPIFMSALFVGGWLSLSPDFAPSVGVLVDLTPWALATYSLTLISTTLGRFWTGLSVHPWLGAGLIINALLSTVYYAFMVIKRHDPAFEPTSSSYYVMIVLVAAAILLCYRARDRSSA